MFPKWVFPLKTGQKIGQNHEITNGRGVLFWGTRTWYLVQSDFKLCVRPSPNRWIISSMVMKKTDREYCGKSWFLPIFGYFGPFFFKKRIFQCDITTRDNDLAWREEFILMMWEYIDIILVVWCHFNIFRPFPATSGQCGYVLDGYLDATVRLLQRL